MIRCPSYPTSCCRVCRLWGCAPRQCWRRGAACGRCSRGRHSARRSTPRRPPAVTWSSEKIILGRHIAAAIQRPRVNNVTVITHQGPCSYTEARGSTKQLPPCFWRAAVLRVENFATPKSINQSLCFCAQKLTRETATAHYKYVDRWASFNTFFYFYRVFYCTIVPVFLILGENFYILFSSWT